MMIVPSEEWDGTDVLLRIRSVTGGCDTVSGSDTVIELEDDEDDETFLTLDDIEQLLNSPSLT